MHWKTLMILSTIGWTIWGIVVKLALQKIDWARLEVLSGFAAIFIMALLAPSGFKLKMDGVHLTGLIAGSAGVFGAIFFYMAVSKGPVSVIIPVTSLYVVGVFLVGVLFLGEQWSMRKGIAVLLALTAVILLSMEEA